MNGSNRDQSLNGSGFKVATKYNYTNGYVGGSTFVNPEYESTIKQNTKVPEKETITIPFINIKLL